MKRLFVILVALAGLAVYAANLTQEVLVLASAATSIPRISSSRGIELLNLGPNSIWCAQGASTFAIVNKSRKIAAGGSWGAAIPGNVTIFCIAETADQVTGAATVTNEVY